VAIHLLRGHRLIKHVIHHELVNVSVASEVHLAFDFMDLDVPPAGNTDHIQLPGPHLTPVNGALSYHYLYARARQVKDSTAQKRGGSSGGRRHNLT